MRKDRHTFTEREREREMGRWRGRRKGGKDKRDEGTEEPMKVLTS